MARWRGLATWTAAALWAVAIPGPVAGHDLDGQPGQYYEASAADGAAYPVSGFRFEIESPTPEAPAFAELAELKIELGQVRDGYVGPTEKVPTTRVPLAAAPYSNYYASALGAIRVQIKEYLEDEGFENVIVYPLDGEIEPGSGRDLRRVGQVNLTLVVSAAPKTRRGGLFR